MEIVHHDREATWRTNSRRRCEDLGSSWVDVKLSTIWARTAGRCHLCGAVLEPSDWEPDHIRPLARGGAHDLANLAPCCPDCNRRKGATAGQPSRGRAAVQLLALAHRLSALGIPARLGHVTVGPAVTTVRISIAAGHWRDALAAGPELTAALNEPGARIFQHGRWLTLELPHPERATVALGDMKARGLALTIGRGPAGELVTLDLARSPHVLIGGQTGSGKSTALRTIAHGLIMGGAARLALVDSDADTWAPMTRSSALIAGVADDRPLATALIRHVAQIMNERAGSGHWAPIVLLVDEVSTLEPEALAALKGIAQRGRKRAVHLVVATQYVRADVLDRALTDQYGWRIAGRVQDATASRLIIGRGGAELLGGAGDMILAHGGASVRVQVAHGTDADWARLPALDTAPEPVTLALDAPDPHPGHVREDDSLPLEWAMRQAAAGGDVSATAIRERFAIGTDRARRIRDEVKRRLTG